MPPPRSPGCAHVPSITWDSVFAPLSGGNGDGRAAAANRLPRCLDIDLACLIYTSGTTGNPKGVMCSHRDVVSAARSIIQYLENRPEDVILNALPLSFGYGLYQVLMSAMFGGTVVLESSFLYPHLMLKRVAQEKVTGPAPGAEHGRHDAADREHRHVRFHDAAVHDQCERRPAGAAPDAPAPADPAREILQHVWPDRMCAGVLPGRRRAGSATGLRGPAHAELRGVPWWTRTATRWGRAEIGELIIRGSNVMQGYWNDPEMTARVYRPGPYPAWRWLHSGDYFRRDEEGFLHFVGRKDDMIKTRGERVSPKEVEDTICELEAVAEAAAIGVPDEILGQAIKVFVVTRTGGLDEKAILRHCANRLSPFMVPKYVEFVPGIPKTAHGKISRRELQTSEGK